MTAGQVQKSMDKQEMADILNRRFTFSGCKVALLLGSQILTSLRDDFPTIPHPNMWDLPGGGREGEETPFECLKREVKEELSLELKPEAISWAKIYPSMLHPEELSVFTVASISQEQFDQIVFGDEGQDYKLTPVGDFLTDEQVIPQLRGRVKDYMEEISGKG